MHRARLPRFGVVLMLGAAALTVGVSSAGASTSSRSVVRAQQGTAVRSMAQRLDPGLAAGLLPRAAANPFRELWLTTDPMPITVNGTKYSITVEADSSPGQANPQTFSQITFGRTVTVNRELQAEQDHTYSYFGSSGPTLTTGANDFSTRLAYGSAFAPTSVDLTLNRISLTNDPCTLFPGGKGHAVTITGSISSAAFSVVTPTTPFFGTVTTAPAAGELIDDPGCINGPLQSGAGGTSLETCAGRDTIQTGSAFGTAFWASQIGFEGHRASTVALIGHQTSTRAVGHLAGELGTPRGVLPVGKHGPHGATARLRSTGMSFFSGGAAFNSGRAPHVSVVQRCVWEHHVHRYRGYRYSGTLAPVPGAGLTARFDTGAVKFGARNATLVIRKYVS